jgi:PAS domain S-box-containing protein
MKCGAIVGTELLSALPAAIYTTDAEGRITFYNDAAAQLWGTRPLIGEALWCGSWRLYWSDGRPMAHEACPMAKTLKEGRPCVGQEAILERPDGTRVHFRPFPSLLRDASGKITGGINLMVDISDRREADVTAARLAAIVASSDDAIVSKTLDGIVTSWNGGAVRIFGYQPEEMIGQSIKRIIPAELQSEEDDILARLRRGERIDHFDTVRLAKDGRRVEISLTVSPIRDGTGTVVGASKVARDVGERKRHEEMQRLLLDELNHRVKNTLATIQAIASQSMRSASSPRSFVDSFNGRVQALAGAHDLLVQGKMKGTGLIDLLRQQVALGPADGSRISYFGPDAILEPRLAVQLALVLHELATNARKYGALSVPTGRLSVSWTVGLSPDRELRLSWEESGVPRIAAPRTRGFGTTLIERSLAANGGEAEVGYAADGLRCRITLPLPPEPLLAEKGEAAWDERSLGRLEAKHRAGKLRGKRILVVEDEPLVAMDLEAELGAMGMEVVGPASTVAAAEQLIERGTFDLALLDANLHGHSTDAIAAALARAGIPFAFATGYGPEALPEAFRQVPILAKPFDASRLAATLAVLLANAPTGDVVPMRPRAS